MSNYVHYRNQRKSVKEESPQKVSSALLWGTLIWIAVIAALYFSWPWIGWSFTIKILIVIGLILFVGVCVGIWLFGQWINHYDDGD